MLTKIKKYHIFSNLKSFGLTKVNQKHASTGLINKNTSHFSSKIKSPISLSFFRDDAKKEILKKSLVARFKSQPQNMILNMQSQLQSHKKLLYELEMLNREVNILNQSMKKIMKHSKTNNEDQDSIKQQANKIKIQIKSLKFEQENKLKLVSEIVIKIQQDLKNFGNIVNESIKVSKNQQQNKVIKQYTPKDYSEVNKQLSYHQIFQKLKLQDLKRGQKVSGHRGYFLKSQSVKIALALAQYALDYLQSKGYTIYQTPTLIQQQVLQQSCQLNTIQNDMYKVDNNENLYLVATSQQSLAGFYQRQVVNHNQFPIKMGGYSSCYRKEAGAHGKDIQGIFRVHQFQKVEQFIICPSGESDQQFNSMLQVCEQFYQSLKIPYRLVQIVSGELNDAASKKVDLEGWYPKQKRFRQLVSVSNCTDYQSRMLSVQYLNANQYQYPHMLNGTLIAIQRAMTCFVQNWQDQKGVQIPEVLHQYLRRTPRRLEF